jgi:hypothetical protein
MEGSTSFPPNPTLFPCGPPPAGQSFPSPALGRFGLRSLPASVHETPQHADIPL